jgi:hypothetical protein
MRVGPVHPRLQQGLHQEILVGLIKSGVVHNSVLFQVVTEK